MTTAQPGGLVSIVIPMRNEAGNVGPLLAEILAAMGERASFEIICVDDGSTDATRDALLAVAAAHDRIRPLRHDRTCGQSCAIRTGVLAARGELILTLDGDGQNDPAYLPVLLDRLRSAPPRTGLVAGQRVGRQDTGFKRWQSRAANRIRAAVLRDGTRDTGCGLKAFRRDIYLSLPYFDALHRFMPALIRREGYDVAYVEVFDRPRLTGQSNYGFLDRLFVGALDLAGVWWLIRRRRLVPIVTEIRKP